MSNYLKLRNVRLSFADALATPKQYKNKGKARYSANFIIAQDHPQLDDVRSAIMHAAETKWPGNGKTKAAMLIKKNETAFRNGNENLNSDGEIYEGYENTWYIAAHRPEVNGPPAIVNSKLVPVQPGNPQWPYSGCYVDALLNFWADDRYGEKINCSIDVVRFRAEGESFGGGLSRESAVSRMEAIETDGLLD